MTGETSLNKGLTEKAKSWDKLNKHFNGFLDLYINHYSTLTNTRNNWAIVEKLKESIDKKHDGGWFNHGCNNLLKEILSTTYHSKGSEGES